MSSEAKGVRRKMSKSVFGFALAALLLGLSFPTEAQQPKKVPRIGYLSIVRPSY